MKTRKGFVSNSSSSSYIIALKKTSKPCPHCGRKDADLLEAIEKAAIYNDDNGVGARGQAVKSLPSYAYLDDSIKHNIADFLEVEHQGEWEVAEISISYHDDIVLNIFDNLVASKNVIIIHRD